MLKILATQLKEKVKRQSPVLLRLIGLRLLSSRQTEDLLLPYQIHSETKPMVALAEVRDASDPNRIVFPYKEVETSPDYVWDYPNQGNQTRLLNTGNLRIGNQFLNTDFGNYTVLTSLLSVDRRETREAPILLALWSHTWDGFFDFTLFVAAKLCRLKASMDPADFARAVVSYPLVDTSFERELLGLIGIGANQLLDSRRYAPRFDRCLLANNSSWFYPSMSDARALKAVVEEQLPPPAVWPRKRLYISRSGRRRVLNEEALVQMLLRYDFEIIEDVPRSMPDQVRLYQSASFIIGPHGASFANLLWCRPGTQLFEFFAPQYGPEFFRYLTHMLRLRYAVYSMEAVTGCDHSHVQDDILVSVDAVEQGLVRLLKEEALANT